MLKYLTLDDTIRHPIPRGIWHGVMHTAEPVHYLQDSRVHVHGLHLYGDQPTLMSMDRMRLMMMEH